MTLPIGEIANNPLDRANSYSEIMDMSTKEWNGLCEKEEADLCLRGNYLVHSYSVGRRKLTTNQGWNEGCQRMCAICARPFVSRKYHQQREQQFLLFHLAGCQSLQLSAWNVEQHSILVAPHISERRNAGTPLVILLKSWERGMIASCPAYPSISETSWDLAFNTLKTVTLN